ncbi:glycine--tRNA ligase subunit beta [bacterium]|nr:glycine--tRNA ligase subunit beta [bacterium]
MPDLLFELYSEELPASYLDRAIDSLPRAVFQRLSELRLLLESASEKSVRCTGSPRRIVFHFENVLSEQASKEEELVGPPVSAALKEGKPTKAAEEFAKKVGVALEKLEQRDVPGKKGRYLVGKKKTAAQPALAVLPQALVDILKSIEFPKSMTWVPGSKLRFARPLREIVALLGGEVVPLEWNGVRSGRVTRGHPFLAPGPIELASASWDAYERALEKWKVIVDREKRRSRIRELVSREAGRAPNEKIVEVTANLVEWPEVMTGRFDERFLEIPASVIRAAIEGHLRAFPIADANGALASRFAFVANRPKNETIVRGNERVLAARLSDSLFFFKKDQEQNKLKEIAPKLKDVVFQEKLGSYSEKQERVGKLALELAGALGWKSAETIGEAAALMKADLLTEVVGEFPELQGEIGSDYARRQGIADEVARAIREAYLPRHERDELPETRTGIALSIAERLDNAVSAFATGMKPTGSKDPLGVRRQVIGVLRILRERQLSVSLERLVASAAANLPEAALAPRKKPDPKAGPYDFAAARRALATEVLEYARGRLVTMAQDEGHRSEIVQAVLRVGFSDVPDVWSRLDALERISREPWFLDLAKLAERTRNITKDAAPGEPSSDSLQKPAEKALFSAIEASRPRVLDALSNRRYDEAAKLVFDSLFSPVDQFMKDVLVNDPDAAIRKNRLALLKVVHGLLAERFADLAEVATSKTA